MKAKTIIQARCGSSRLPEKILLKIMGKTILEYVIERVSKASKVDAVIIATTFNLEEALRSPIYPQLNIEKYFSKPDYNVFLKNLQTCGGNVYE